MDKKNEQKEVNVESFARYVKYGVIGLVVLALIGAGLVWFNSYTTGFVATVAGEKVSAAEFNFFLTQEKSNMLYNAQLADPNLDVNKFWDTQIDGEKAIDVAKKRALDKAKELKIQVIKAREQNLKVDPDTLKGLTDSIENFRKQSGTKAEADTQAVATYGVKLDELSDIYKEFLLTQELVKKETEGMTADKLPEYYEKYPDAFKDTQFRLNAEEAVWARHILINAAKDAAADVKETAKKKADDILAKIKSGEDFVKLAKENSEDPGSAQSGGDYVFGKGQMVAEFEKTAFELAPGQVSEIVTTDFGYHIIKLEEKIEKDKPVSLKCATEYREFGLPAAQSAAYQEKLDEWKKDPKYDVKKNEGTYNSIK